MHRVFPYRLAVCAILVGVHLGSSATTLGSSGLDACAILSASEIVKATSLTVGNGTAGAAIPGVLGKCTWAGPGDTKVILTLADTQHMQMTIAAQERSGATAVTGVGSKAVAIKGPPFAGGGYILSVLDAKGGFGVSVLGAEGTQERALALARLVESHRQ
jgi:hypothetical protein